MTKNYSRKIYYLSKIQKDIVQFQEFQQKTSFTQDVYSSQSKLSCQICRQIMILPTRLQCQHLFCLPCCEMYLYSKRVCYICRQPQSAQEYSVCEVLQDQIENLIQKLQQNQKNQYQNRYQHYQKQQKKRSIAGCFRCDMLIDFRDLQQNKWRQGKILEICCRNDLKQDMIVVQPLTNSCEKFIFRISSRNIANFGYFTLRQTEVDYVLLQQQSLQQTIALCQFYTNNINNNDQKESSIKGNHTGSRKYRFGKKSGKRPNHPSSQKNLKNVFYQINNYQNVLIPRQIQKLAYKNNIVSQPFVQSSYKNYYKYWS